ncbi:site-specific recombinase [Dyella sp. 2HG41-7]|uniref:site-specific recombinase n=1 Tax=Dyella sp. 2HG41-7 TaxID=2883239 RepID=UPI001F31F538|nr:site-specific recombinase [Dyella sp. 2HG41-7]
MPTPIANLWRKWRESRSAGRQIDALLAHADPDAALAVRNEWLIEVSHWLHREGTLASDVAQPDRTPKYRPHVRLRYLLQLLDRNPAWRANVALTLQSIVRDTDAMALLCDSGMPAHAGFSGALFERLQDSLIPPAPNSRDLSALFALIFQSANDAQWVGTLPRELLAKLGDLFAYRESAEDARSEREESTSPSPSRLSMELLAALHNVTGQIGSAGLSKAIRTRLTEKRLDALPFYKLPRAMLAIETAAQTDAANALDEHPSGISRTVLQEVNYLRALLDECHRSLRDVHTHLDQNGVSVDIVFQIERMRARITRAERLLEAWLAIQRQGESIEPVASLFADLIAANQSSRSIGSLIRKNFSLLARKVVDRSAEDGEHYVAYDRKEYLQMLWAAIGGGLVTVATVYIKFFIVAAHMHPMIEGLFAGINYALSFLLMHFLHFTLATKQPAMTAPMLAQKLDDIGTPQGMGDFVQAVVALIRTQAAAIFGNLIAVFPVCLAIQLGARYALGVDIISPEKAHATLHSFSLLGVTPFYAVGTGILLWSSSLLAGWADNWFVLHRLHDVLSYNRRLRFVMGERGAVRFANFWSHHVAGVTANLSLGLMLGLVPSILTAFALPFEVRHVTLSTGSIGVSLGVLGQAMLRTSELWWAVAGTASMAVLNVAVSFTMAFQMALRARPIQGRARHEITKAVWRYVLAHPWRLLFPVKSPAAADSV